MVNVYHDQLEELRAIMAEDDPNRLMELMKERNIYAHDIPVSVCTCIRRPQPHIPRNWKKGDEVIRMATGLKGQLVKRLDAGRWQVLVDVAGLQDWHMHEFRAYMTHENTQEKRYWQGLVLPQYYDHLMRTVRDL